MHKRRKNNNAANWQWKLNFKWKKLRKTNTHRTKILKFSRPTLHTLPKPHQPTLQPKLCQRVQSCHRFKKKSLKNIHMPKIFDNISLHLRTGLLETIESSYRADFCVGYFNLRGWKLLMNHIDQFDG